MPVNIYDAQANLAFVRAQTEHVEALAYQTQYPEIQYPRLIPVDTTAPEFATAVTYVSVDGAGRASWLAGAGANDIPVVAQSRSETKKPVYTAGIGYDYTWEEIGQAQMLGHALTADKAQLSRRIAEEMIERVAFSGDADKGFEAFVANSGVSAGNVALNAGGSSRLWSAKTALEILADINDAINDVWSDSLTVEMADTVLLSPERLAYIASTPMSADNPSTILDMVKRTNLYTMMTGQPLTIASLRQLATAGASSTQRMVAYARRPDVVKLHIPMTHRFLPAQLHGLNYLIPGVMRMGGVDIRRPGAVRYRDGF